jgi:hypothetical protein
MKAVELVGFLFMALFLFSLSLHVLTTSKLRALRERVNVALSEDRSRRFKHKELLGPLRRLVGDVNPALLSPVAIRVMDENRVLEGVRGKVEHLSNETLRFVNWMQNHVLMGHDLARDFSTTEDAEVKVCIPVSITTRGTKWKSLEEMLLLTSFLPSLVRTVESGFHFGVYLGYDADDPLLDSPEQVEKLRKLVESIVGSASISLRSFRYEDSRNRNVWAVNYITRECYLDGYDYFYRVNDDSAFEDLWAHTLTARLRETNDFGVVGVYDKQNPRIFTHSLVGRPHIEVFGYYFPFEFGNYWSDDWITFVYMPPYVHKAYDVAVKHHTHAERYKVEHERRKVFDEMVNLGRLRWKSYLCLVRKLSDYCTGKERQFIGTWPDE